MRRVAATDSGLAVVSALLEAKRPPARIRILGIEEDPDDGLKVDCRLEIVGADPDSADEVDLAHLVVGCAQLAGWRFGTDPGRYRLSSRRLRLLEGHLEAWRLCAPLGRLQFDCGRGDRRPVRLAWKLLEAHVRAVGSMDGFEQALRWGIDAVELLAGGHGILTRGHLPVPLLFDYAAALRREGVRTWIIDLRPPRTPPPGDELPLTLELGPLIIVGTGFAAEGIGVDVARDVQIEELEREFAEAELTDSLDIDEVFGLEDVPGFSEGDERDES